MIAGNTTPLIPSSAPARLAPDAPWNVGPRGLGSSLLKAQRSFAGVLSRAEHRADASGVTPEQQAREGAESLVALAFVQPMLKEFREANKAAAPFAPTPAEKQFRALMDAELAQRIVRAADFPLVERLARDLLRTTSASPTTAGAEPPAAGVR